MPRTTNAAIARQIADVRKSLTSLDRSFGKLMKSIGKAGAGNGLAANTNGRTTRNLSPRARAALKLQGRYMGFMRQLKPRQKSQVRALKERRGVEAAIRRAQKLASAN